MRSDGPVSLAGTSFPCRLVGVGLALVLFIILPGLAHPFGVAKESVIALVSAFALFAVATGPAPSIRPWPWWWTLLLLAPAGVMTVAAMANDGSVLASDGPVRLWCYAVFFLSMRLACPDPDDMRRLVHFATVVGGIEGALVVAQVMAGHLVYDWSGIPSAKWKAFGTLGNPNWVGAYLAATLPLAVARLHGASGRSACTRPALLVSMTFAGLVLTLSRGAWIAAASGLAALALLDRTPAWRRTGLTVAAVLPLTVAIAWAGFGGGEVREALLRQASITGRLRIWESSLTMVAARPVLGWGPGQFAGAYPAAQHAYVTRHGADPRITELTDHPHSEYLYFATEGGALALLALLAVTGVAVGWGVRGAADSVGLAAALIAISVHGVSDIPLHLPATAALFCVLLVAIFTAHAERNGSRIRALTSIERAALLLLTVLSVLQASRLLLVDRRLQASRYAFAAGDAALAEQVAQDGLALEPAHGELWGVVAYARAERDDAAGTLAAAARAQALLPSPAITYLMASTERRQGHPERALALLRECSGTLPGLIRPRVLLAETYVELGQIEAAKTTLMDALTMPSKFVTKEEQRLRTEAAALLQRLDAR